MDMTTNKAYDMGKRTIDNILIDVFGEETNEGSAIDYRAGTTGYRGKANGGAKTYISFMDEDGILDFGICPVGEPETVYIDEYDQNGVQMYKGAEIILKGDTELSVCIETLENMLDILKAQAAPTMNNMDED